MSKRLRQKGAKCGVDGCNNWCVSKGLCHKHVMALRRYGNVGGGKISREGICKVCGNKFRLIKSNQEYCNGKCYKETAKYKKVAFVG